MKTYLTRFVATAALTALMTVPARAQIKRDRKPAGDLTAPVKSGTGQQVPRPKGGDRLDGVDLASRVVSLTNAFRTQEGKPKLKSSASLDKIAQRYAGLMASKDQLAQIDPVVGADRLTEAPNVFTAWRGQVGVQYGKKDPAGTQFQQWSNRHGRAYLLSANVTVIGVGVATSSTAKVYFCYLLAKPE